MTELSQYKVVEFLQQEKDAAIDRKHKLIAEQFYFNILSTDDEDDLASKCRELLLNKAAVIKASDLFDDILQKLM